MKVSVIVPVYNSGKYLKKCLNSLVNQTLKDIEIIIIDDGSTDKSRKIIAWYKSQYPNMIKVILCSHNGVAYARNLGIKEAQGEYIKFVDADDYLSINALELMYNAAKKYDVDIVVSPYKMSLGFLKFKDKCNFHKIKNSTLVDVKLTENFIIKETSGIGDKLFKRSIVKTFPIDLRWEDLGIVPYLLAEAGKIYYLNKKMYYYRVHLNTTIKAFLKQDKSLTDIFKILGILEDEFKSNNLYDKYENELKELEVLHILFRIEELFYSMKIKKKKKRKVIALMLNYLNLKYENFNQYKIIKDYKKSNLLFRIFMNRLSHIEPKNYKDESKIIKKIEDKLS